jgi:choline kinase
MAEARAGVLLAAGLGSRLAGAPSAHRLKPLTRVGGVPLLERAVRSLEVAGCARTIVVVGHGADDVESEVARLARGHDVVAVTNSRYELKNGVSALVGAEAAGGEIVLAMADHVVGDEVMRLCRDHTPPPGGATLLVDRRVAQVFDLDDATKVATEGDRIVRIGKELETFDAIDVGVFVCTQGLADALRAVLAAKGDASLSEGIQALAAKGAMAALDIGDGFWQDVDTPEMLAHAEAELARRSR